MHRFAMEFRGLFHVLLTMLHYWVSYLPPFDHTSALLIPQDVAFNLLDQGLHSYDTTASPCTRFVVCLLTGHCSEKSLMAG